MEDRSWAAALAAFDEAGRALVDLANRQVRVTAPDGRRIRVTRFEARLLELASPDCRRRIMCQDFITQVRAAVLRKDTAGM